MVKHQPLQVYEKQVFLSFVTGVYGWRWKRYQRSQDDSSRVRLELSYVDMACGFNAFLFCFGLALVLQFVLSLSLFTRCTLLCNIELLFGEGCTQTLNSKCYVVTKLCEGIFCLFLKNTGNKV